MTPSWIWITHQPEKRAKWLGELSNLLDMVGVPAAPVKIQKVFAPNPGASIVFVDVDYPALDECLQKAERNGRAIFLVSDRPDEIPSALAQGLVDDVLVFPFRTTEVLGKLKQFEHILLWQGVQEANKEFEGTLDRMRADLALAERLQKQMRPKRFDGLRGFKVGMRYFAGARSGGDYFDLYDSEQGDRLSLILTDASSYGLSSSVLSVMLRIASRLTKDDTRWVAGSLLKGIYGELQATLGPTDHLSFFTGQISRKDLTLQYMNMGTCKGFRAPKGKEFEVLEGEKNPIMPGQRWVDGAEKKLGLDPSDRLVFLSDGFIDSLGGVHAAQRLLSQYRGKEAADSLNELAYQVKSRLGGKDELPAQDCSAVVLDVEEKFLRVAR